MTRRKLFRVLLGALAWTESRLVLWRPGRPGDAAAATTGSTSESLSATGALSPGERESILAFAAVLIEGRALSAAERRHLGEHIDHRTQNIPGYLALYRLTANLLDRLAAAPFSTIDLPTRTAIVVRHRLTPDHPRRKEETPPSQHQAFAVQTLAVPDLIGGYYASPAGWAAVGYAAFPGRCSDLVRYTRPEP